MNIRLKYFFTVIVIAFFSAANVTAQNRDVLSIERYDLNNNLLGSGSIGLELKETLESGARVWSLQNSQTIDLGEGSYFRADMNSSEYAASIEVSENPSISFGGFEVSVSDTSIINLSFDSPIFSGTLPVGGTFVRSSLDVILIDSTFNGVTLTPNPAPLMVANVTDGSNITNLGVDLGFAPINGISGNTGGVTSVLLSAGSPTFNGPTLTYEPNEFEVYLSFTLTAGDSVALGGRVDVSPNTTPIPEPSAMAFLSIFGLTFSAYLVYRRGK